MNKPTVVLWDVMGTLVHDPFFVEVPEFFGMPLRELITAKHPTSWVEFERGEIDEGAMLRRFFLDGRTFDGEGLKAVMKAAYRWLEGVEPIVTELHRRAVPMHALSNYPDWYRLIEDQLTLSRYLEWSFVSCRLGVRKPDPDIYRRVIAELGVAASACVFIDDREDNCAGARAVGMHAVHFSGADNLVGSLAALGLPVSPAPAP